MRWTPRSSRRRSPTGQDPFMCHVRGSGVVLSRHVNQRTVGSGRATTRYVAVGSQTERDFGLFEYTLSAGSPGASAHYHQHFSETFYVLEGDLGVLDGSDWVKAEAGDLVYVPRGSVHGFRNDSNVDTRFLILFTPGAPREEYFDGLAARRASGVEPTQAEIDEFARRHDQINIR